MDDQSHALGHLQRLEQSFEVTAVLDETIGITPAVRQLFGVTHADQVGGDAAPQRLEMRYYIAPKIG